MFQVWYSVCFTRLLHCNKCLGTAPRPIRVLLLGKENVGKTSIARLLRNAKAKPERDLSTDGVEVRRFFFFKQ